MRSFTGIDGIVFINPDSVAGVANCPNTGHEGDWSRVLLTGGGSVLVSGDSATVASALTRGTAPVASALTRGTAPAGWSDGRG